MGNEKLTYFIGTITMKHKNMLYDLMIKNKHETVIETLIWLIEKEYDVLEKERSNTDANI